jgi:thioredoxin reductase
VTEMTRLPRLAGFRVGQRVPMTELEPHLVDVAVIGGGPAGLSAALWVARYRRTVVLIDAGRRRNRWSDAMHGYLGFDGAPPTELIDRASAEVDAHPEVWIERDTDVTSLRRAGSVGFDVELADGRVIRALRVILATGVRDTFPDIESFEDFYGRSVVTCPSCDGYEAQGRTVAVVGDDEALVPFALGLLDWAVAVTVIVTPETFERGRETFDELTAAGVRVAPGKVVAFRGDPPQIRSIVFADGASVECDVAFCSIQHGQHSELPAALGCEIDDDGCVVVDKDGQTTVERVYAAGDMTPGPHLVQVAAAKGAVAGIAAAASMRGHRLPLRPVLPPIDRPTQRTGALR